eukprot:TRINITY_DN5234_c6_g1_i1.p1 TRINITY_DN5234_c6_g1~~TRINITY_DN5234_c6_g1_i1.p1  ORF type:complete len:127 (+),score=21.05 TRINITY_DN5234_c6_g1_i1:61-441(+)
MSNIENAAKILAESLCGATSLINERLKEDKTMTVVQEILRLSEVAATHYRREIELLQRRVNLLETATTKCPTCENNKRAASMAAKRELSLIDEQHEAATRRPSGSMGPWNSQEAPPAQKKRKKKRT